MKRKVILFIASSLDGYIARADGGIDWLFSDEDYGYTPFFAGVDTVIMGRHTYGVSRAFTADPFPGKHVYVYSRTRAGQREGPAMFTDEPADCLVARLRQSPGGNIWLVGGAQMVREFMLRDLIDEYIISIHPVVLGDGISLFPAPLDTHWLKLERSESFDSGLVQITYSARR